MTEGPTSTLTERPYPIGALSAGESFDHGLYLLRDNGRVVLIALLVYVIPLGLAMDWLAGMVYNFVDGYMGADTTLPFDLPRIAMYGFHSIVDAAFFATFFEAGCAHYLAHKYMGTPITVRESVRAAARRMILLFPIHVVFYLIFMVGNWFCIVPGMFFYGLFFLRLPVYMLEGQGPIRGLTRSLTLMTMEWPAIFGAMIFMYIGQYVFRGAVGALDVPFVSHVADGLLGALIQAFEVAMTVVLYFSARSRREHLDLDLLAQQAAAPDSAAPAL